MGLRPVAEIAIPVQTQCGPWSVRSLSFRPTAHGDPPQQRLQPLGPPASVESLSPGPQGWVGMHPLPLQPCIDEQEGEMGTLTLQ